jgi:hypothetical protein
VTIAPVIDADSTEPVLTVRRLNVLRGGYAFMGLGLVVVKWPMLIDVRSLPAMEGVVVCILTAMSLLAFLGLRHPVKLLPILLFEVSWKIIWIATVAIPHLVADDLTPELRNLLFSCSFVVVILAVIPWRYTWNRFAHAPGDAWR